MLVTFLTTCTLKFTNEKKKKTGLRENIFDLALDKNNGCNSLPAPFATLEHLKIPARTCFLYFVLSTVKLELLFEKM